LGLGSAAALHLEVFFVFLLAFSARRSIDIWACTLFVNFRGLDPDRRFNEMVNKLDVVLSNLLNLNTKVFSLSMFVLVQAPFE